MKDVLDAFWRAVAYCLHPKVILWSLAPLLVAGGLTWLLGRLYWESAIDAVHQTLDQWALTAALARWLVAIGGQSFRSMLDLLVLVGITLPIVVTFSLLLVALFMTPAMTRLVAQRRFPTLEKREGGSWLGTLLRSIGCTVVALGALIVSVPLWFIPPLVMVIPPLIWGWLTYQVMTTDVLSAHATSEERRRILREQRWPLLAIGLVAGYLGAAPALLWSVSAMVLPFAPLLIPASVWLYTLIFAFASLWFAHFALTTLQRMRMLDLPVAPASPPAALDDIVLPPLP